MHALRNSLRLTRLALAWLLLTLAAAVVSPIAHRQPLQRVCTAGAQPPLVVAGEDGAATGGAIGRHSLDCPLCLAGLLLSPAEGSAGFDGTPRPPRHALPVALPAPIALSPGAALPARGPLGRAA